MASPSQHIMSRRGFCLCCMAATTVAASGGWLTPRKAFAEARNIVDLIRDEATKTPIKVHKLRGNVSVLEGSSGNIAVLTGADGKVFIDAGITASRPRILEAANGLSSDPVKHLINTHWHFDHTDGNEWLNAEGAAIIAHENTHKHLLAQLKVQVPRKIRLAFAQSGPCLGNGTIEQIRNRLAYDQIDGQWRTEVVGCAGGHACPYRKLNPVGCLERIGRSCTDVGSVQADPRIDG